MPPGLELGRRGEGDHPPPLPVPFTFYHKPRGMEIPQRAAASVGVAVLAPGAGAGGDVAVLVFPITGPLAQPLDCGRSRTVRRAPEDRGADGVAAAVARGVARDAV